MRTIKMKMSVAAMAGFLMLFVQNASAQYLQSQFDVDYIQCSEVAEQKSRGFSDAMYLGMFYGCMADRGYEVESFT